MPVYISSVASSLREDRHQVTIVDHGACEELCQWDEAATSRRMAEIIAAFEADAVLCDVRYLSWPVFQGLARAIKDSMPGVVLMAGGRHPTVAPVDSLRNCPELDAALVGEPEPAMRMFASGTPLTNITAFAARAAGGFPGRRDMPVEDMDTLPFPAWDLLDMDHYTRKTPRVIPCLRLKTAAVETSRGCTAGCRFCAEGRLAAGRHRWHSASYVADEIEQLIKDYAIEGVYFSDESFLANRERVAVLCDEFIRRGLGKRVVWTAQVRTDSVDPEILAAMKRAGCVQLEFGVESGSQRVLDSLLKGSTVEANMAAVRMTREAGIRSMTYTMRGIPDETLEDFRATAEFIRQARPDIVRMTEYVPLPGTVLIRRLVSSGRLTGDYWSGTGTSTTHASKQPLNLTAMDTREYRREAKRIYFRHVFPRFARDFLRHNPPWSIPRVFRMKALFAFLWRKIFA